MSIATVDLVMIRTNSTNYYFLPTELNYQTFPSRQKNQVVQEADSGEVKVLTLSTSEIKIHEFIVNKMRATDRTVSGITIRGWNTLLSLVTGSSTMNFRANTCDIWLPGTSKVGSADFTARYWSDTIFAPSVRNVGGRIYVGDGSQVIRFRQEV